MAKIRKDKLGYDPSKGKPSHVRLGNNVLLYEDKAPYEVSGMSVKGGVELDAAEDLLKCHECGKWYKGLGNHIHGSHGMSALEYKRKHGLGYFTSLIAESRRVQMIEQGKKNKRLYWDTDPKLYLKANAARKKKRQSNKDGWAVRHNLRMTCRAQILSRVKSCANAVGHIPDIHELREHGMHPASIYRRFGSVSNAVKMAGLQHLKDNRMQTYSDEQLLYMLKTFVKLNERLPSSSDFRRNLIVADRTTFYRRFKTCSFKKILRNNP